MVELAAELVNNREAMGIDITPVINAAARAPGGIAQHLETVSRTEYYQAVIDGRKGEEVNLVLGDENP